MICYQIFCKKTNISDRLTSLFSVLYTVCKRLFDIAAHTRHIPPLKQVVKTDLLENNFRFKDTVESLEPLMHVC